MQKTLIAVVVLALVGAGLHYLLTSYQPSPDALSELNQQEGRQMPGGESELGADGEVRGTIVSVNTEQAMADGPYLVIVRQEDGEVAVIAVPSMGLPLCAARANIADVSLLAEGQLVEARGAAGSEGAIVPCESAEHYLRVIELN